MNTCKTKIEDYTLKDVKRMCEQRLDCPGCPLYSDRFDYCALVDKIPEKWKFEDAPKTEKTDHE